MALELSALLGIKRPFTKACEDSQGPKSCRRLPRMPLPLYQAKQGSRTAKVTCSVMLHHSNTDTTGHVLCGNSQDVEQAKKTSTAGSVIFICRVQQVSECKLSR